MIKRTKYYLVCAYFGFKTKIIYLASTWISSLCSIVFLLVHVMIWLALLGNGARFNTTFEEMLTFVIITYIASTLSSSSSGEKISKLIRNGDLSIFMTRPINLKLYFFFEDFGTHLYSVILFSIPACILLSITWGFVVPNNIYIVLLTILMLINGIFLLFHYRYLLGLVSFWLIENPFTSWGFQNSERIFSGATVPIWLYPEWLATITQFLPFRYIIYEPIAFYLGKSHFESAGMIIVIQIVWMGVFFVLEKIVSARAMHKLVVQGG